MLCPVSMTKWMIAAMAKAPKPNNFDYLDPDARRRSRGWQHRLADRGRFEREGRNVNEKPNAGSREPPGLERPGGHDITCAVNHAGFLVSPQNVTVPWVGECVVTQP